MKKQYSPVETSNTEQVPIWLGTWSMGGEGWGFSDDRESLKVLDKAISEGLHYIDTAGLYGHGKSELLLGKALSGRRKKVFVSTKGGLVWNGRQVEHRGALTDLRVALEESLERLNTDYIDLYQLHWPDPKVPIEESLEALRAFQKSGLIKHYGVGNLTAKEVSEVLPEEGNIAHQVHFNPLYRDEEETLRVGHEKNRCFNCAYSPLEQGLLVTGQRELGKKDLRNRNALFSNPNTKRWLQGFEKVAREGSIPKVSLILSWILSRKAVDAVICGPRKLSQLDDVLQAIRWQERGVRADGLDAINDLMC